jgi:two-component system cell cycle response regulator
MNDDSDGESPGIPVMMTPSLEIKDLPTIVFPPAGGAPRRWPHLVVMNRPVPGEVFRVIQPETTIGREDTADIRPFHGRVSRKHARLTVARGERVVIEDLGSSNGTFMDGQQLRSQRILNDGDMVVLGGGTMLRLAYSTILDQALRIREYAGAGVDGDVRAVSTANFFDLLRICQVRASMFRSPFTLVLFRVDGMPPQGDAALEATIASNEAMRKVVGIIRDDPPPDCVMARPSAIELVMLARISTDQMLRKADRIRQRVERARSLNSHREAGTTLTAAVLPLPVGGLLAPETFLCAAGDQVRRAMASQTNCVLSLPKLDLRPETAKDEDSQP